MIKNLAFLPVAWLKEVDDLPSRWEYEKDEDGQPILDDNGHVKPYYNEDGLRLVDNVDSQSVDPRTATDDEFAKILAEEISTWLEMAGRLGILLDVPGITEEMMLAA